MAVTADVPYKGLTVTGATFTVISAVHKQDYSKSTDTTKSALVYNVEVLMPDGSPQTATGWDLVDRELDGTTPIAPDTTKSPLADAEDHMKARLTAVGATNIVDV